MAIKTEIFTIDNGQTVTEYQVTQLTPTNALLLKAKLLKQFAPVINGIMSSAEVKRKIGKLVDDSASSGSGVDDNIVVSLVQGFVDIDPDNAVNLIKSVVSDAMVEIEPGKHVALRGTNFDTHFGDVGLMNIYKLAAKIIKLNFGDLMKSRSDQ